MIPNLFHKAPLPESVPTELADKVEEFTRSQNQEHFLRQAFFYTVHRWGGNRFNIVRKLPRLFLRDLDKIMQTKGYLHCTTMNYLLRIMAVKSGLFADQDIKLKFTNTWYVAPHQYLEVDLANGEKVTLDPWNYQYGIDYGNYGSGFDSIKIKPVR